jgi:hypothetical protein
MEQNQTIWYAQLVGRTIYLWANQGLYAAELGPGP